MLLSPQITRPLNRGARHGTSVVPTQDWYMKPFQIRRGPGLMSVGVQASYFSRHRLG